MRKSSHSDQIGVVRMYAAMSVTPHKAVLMVPAGELITHSPQLGGYRLGLGQRPRWPLSQQADVREADFQQRRAETVFPRPEDSSQRSRVAVLVDGVVAHQG